MANEIVEQLVDQLQKHTEKASASFGLYQYNGPNEAYIKANKQGLILFAMELLKASNLADNISENSTAKAIPINYEYWMDDRSEIVIQYIQSILSENQNIDAVRVKNNWANALLPFGCIAGTLLLLVLLVIGFWSVVKWLF